MKRLLSVMLLSGLLASSAFGQHTVSKRDERMPAAQTVSKKDQRAVPAESSPVVVYLKFLVSVNLLP